MQIYNSRVKKQKIKLRQHHFHFVILLVLKVHLLLVTCEINNLVALRATNQIAVIPAR